MARIIVVIGARYIAVNVARIIVANQDRKSVVIGARVIVSIVAKLIDAVVELFLHSHQSFLNLPFPASYEFIFDLFLNNTI